MLNDLQIRRYSRQILLRHVGGKGQLRLLSKHVSLLGLGPVGASCAVYLSAAGIGSLSLQDPRKISKTDIGAGGLYTRSQLGMSRTLYAKESLEDLNPDVNVITNVTNHDDSFLVVCGHIPEKEDILSLGTPSWGLRVGVIENSIFLWVGCLLCSPDGLGEGQGWLSSSCAQAAGALAAKEVLRELLGTPSPLRHSATKLDLLSMKYQNETLPCLCNQTSQGDSL